MPSSRPKTVQPKIACDRQPNKPRWTLFAIASFLKRKASIARLPQGGHGEHECSPAETPQLLPFNELAAVADYPQASLAGSALRSEEHTSELQSLRHLV